MLACRSFTENFAIGALEVAEELQTRSCSHLHFRTHKGATQVMQFCPICLQATIQGDRMTRLWHHCGLLLLCVCLRTEAGISANLLQASHLTLKAGWQNPVQAVEAHSGQVATRRPYFHWPARSGRSCSSDSVSSCASQLVKHQELHLSKL